MPKNLGLYNNTLSVPRKKDIDAVQDTVDMHDSDIQQLETDVNGLNTEVSAVKTALTSKQDTITGAASTITDDNLTANRALISNASGKVDVSDITTTELSYLDGATSNIQTQLNSKLSTAPVTSVNSKTGAVVLNASDVGALSTSGGTLTGNLTGAYITGTWLQTLSAGNINSTPDKIAVIDSRGWIYYRTLAELKSDIAMLPLAGGTMSGAIDMGGNKITNVGTPTANYDAANKAYVDAQKGVEVLTQSSQPTAQVNGDMWFQTT